MSLSPSRASRSLEVQKAASRLAPVAMPAQLNERIQQAVSILAAGLLRQEPELKTAIEDGGLSVDALYVDLLLLTSRLLFLRAGRQTLSEADMGSPQTMDWTSARYRRDWLTRVQQAVDALRFLRAGPVGLEPSRCAPDDVAQALLVLRGQQAEHLTAHTLGSAYESLMEYHPVLENGTLVLATAAGHVRKTSGSYYTPDSLIQCVLDTAVDPILERAFQYNDLEGALLHLSVCDPSCGSGQFILAAADRMACLVARSRGRRTPAAISAALEDVAASCLFGVDLNPIAVELCRFHLWIATDGRMRASDVQQRIQWGDSLLGATPRTLQEPLPAAAFSTLSGDHAATVRAHAAQYQAWLKDRPEPVTWNREQADAWCATVLWPRASDSPPPPWHALLGRPEDDSPETWSTMRSLQDRHRFVHWHLAFPQVFSSSGPPNRHTGWAGGFDMVLGNPPWERIEVQDKEWFARRDSRIAEAPNSSARKRLVAELAQSNPRLYAEFVRDRRATQVELHFLRTSGRFALTGRGGINRFAPFIETCRMLVSASGRVGYVVPSALVHDELTRPFFHELMRSRSLLSLYHFDNRKKLFPAVGGMITFCLVTFQGAAAPESKPASFVCFAQSPSDLRQPDRRFELSADDLSLMNPNTRTLPIFRTGIDADLTRDIYRRVPIFIEQGGANPWSVHLGMLFQMSGDSHLFRTRGQLTRDGYALHGNRFTGASEYRPLYEAKMMHQYEHRWATYEGARTVNVKADQRGIDNDVLPRYWVPSEQVERRLARRWGHDWLLVWRDVCRSTDERTVIASIVPRVGVGHTCQLMFPAAGHAGLLLANLNSMVLDYVARQKVGGIHLTYNYLQQLPILPPSTYDKSVPWSGKRPLRDWILERVAELSATSASLRSFAADCGAQQTFTWHAERRATLRADLDAAFFVLYGLSDGAVEHVLSSFPILQRKEQSQYGEFRTRRLVLEALARLR